MNLAVIIPALNPENNLLAYVDELLSFAKVVVVNDGSGEKFAGTFLSLESMKGCTVLHHPKNMGKGVALKTAVEYIKNDMPNIDGVVTADADGQHLVKDVIRVGEALRSNPKNLVLGVREFDENTPRRSFVGNKISAKTMQLLYGIRLNDTQTGLRAISRDHFEWLLSLKGERYEYELNMLIHSKSVGVKILSVDIETVYYNNNEASHFSTVKDGIRVYLHMLYGLFFYLRNSLLCAVVDIGIFTSMFYLTDSVFTATIATTVSALLARTISSVMDFKLNRKTFSGYFASDRPVNVTTSGVSYFKYYILWIAQLTVSTVIVNLFNIYFGALQTIVKPIIDLGLAVISYEIQLHWVFRSDKKSDEGPDFIDCISDILITKEFQDMRSVTQHSPECNRYGHSAYVSYIAYNICNRLGLDAESAARGGILHDFEIPSLTPEGISDFKMLFVHSRIAVEHASSMFKLNEKEKNIIDSHMWPLSVRGVPLSLEAVIVNFADNYCAIIEVFGLYKYTKIAEIPLLSGDISVGLSKI